MKNINTKKTFRVLFKINIFIFTVFLAILGILFFPQTAFGQTEDKEQNTTGWAWVGNSDDDNPNGLPHIGWVSLNCYNYYSPNGVESRCGSNYGVTINPESGDMSGYMWNAVSDTPDTPNSAGGMGWISLDPDAFPTDPQYAARVETKDPNKGQVSGWARINSIKEEGEKLGNDDWGWVLMGPEPKAGRAFGVDIDFDTGDVSGYAWSGSDKDGEGNGLGWIYFNGTKTKSVYDSGTNELSGWAWLGNNTDVPAGFTNIGWMALNCKNGGINGEDICKTVSDFKIKIDPIGGDFLDDSEEKGLGYAWIGSGFDTAGDDSIGWIDFNPNPFPADPNYSAKVFLNEDDAMNDSYQPFEGEDYKAGDIVGWARIPMLEEYGAELGFEDWGWVKLHKTKDETAGYGLALSFGSEKVGEGGKIGGRCYQTTCDDGAVQGKFTSKGYAWSGGGQVAIGGESSKDVGFGWIMFQVNNSFGPTYFSPFFTVEGGSIYAKGKIGSATTFTPPAKSFGGDSFWYNATYLIVSGEGTITHFCSAAGEGEAEACGTDSDFIQELKTEGLGDPFSAPLYKNEYTNALGKIDVDGLVPQNILPGQQNVKNKYGHLVDAYADGTLAENINNDLNETWGTKGAYLNGKVYYIDGDLNVDSDLTFKADKDSAPNGAGLIIVKGNLNINANTDYESVKINKIEELPVVAWVVKGNINISKDVKKTVGVYIDVGNENGGGKISTGDSDELLEVSGAMIAKEFDFQRTGFYDKDKPEERFTNIQPAEKIINDGRAGANTPPGLQDFSLAFPIIRQAAPVEIKSSNE